MSYKPISKCPALDSRVVKVLVYVAYWVWSIENGNHVYIYTYMCIVRVVDPALGFGWVERAGQLSQGVYGIAKTALPRTGSLTYKHVQQRASLDFESTDVQNYTQHNQLTAALPAQAPSFDHRKLGGRPTAKSEAGGVLSWERFKLLCTCAEAWLIDKDIDSPYASPLGSSSCKESALTFKHNTTFNKMSLLSNVHDMKHREEVVDVDRQLRGSFKLRLQIWEPAFLCSSDVARRVKWIR